MIFLFTVDFFMSSSRDIRKLLKKRIHDRAPGFKVDFRGPLNPGSEEIGIFRDTKRSNSRWLG